MAINKRKIQEVNAGSMADISFLLLIFFLVATHMNVDTGINRILPPWQDKVEEQEVKERNVLKVFVSMRNEIMVNSERIDLGQLRARTKDFVLNKANDPNMPEFKVEDIDIIGEYPVSEGIVSLQNDRGTSYGMYIRVQNELTKAFNEIRDDISIMYFRKGYNELNSDQQKAIQKAVPLKISEAEQRNISEGN